MPERAYNDDFTLIDTNGIHEISLDFCGCYEFYHAVARLSDNTGLHSQKDCYEAFMPIVRKWRHLKMLKRAGRGYDSAGVEGMDWCWLYGLFLAIDANFRLKRRMVLKTAWTLASVTDGLISSRRPLTRHIYKPTVATRRRKVHVHPIMRLNMADTKVSHGLAATGVGTVDCARHNMKLPNGVGDLQKGESGTRPMAEDVNMPLLHLDHLATFYVGRTDGKALNADGQISTLWPLVPRNGARLTARTLDDHFGDWNWKKVVGLAFQELDEALAPETTEAWKVEIESWEENPNDSSVTNP
ncbi:hypothetical protein DFJ58DRAFT_876965 [Suillus subalutaceus]|uniref:uncharacterized protein n=1 Tax=Suillus subalutaceus TaxID=48586 RepID=UPI001B865317|nr:uncharacterized protein DFJ58DRAFT_876965 [Suillus subalutaceus]KAG1828599.1 hypothetical protein DFJ58DRAFT_876965 [Suillus subalutaceus]